MPVRLPHLDIARIEQVPWTSYQAVEFNRHLLAHDLDRRTALEHLVGAYLENNDILIEPGFRNGLLLALARWTHAFRYMTCQLLDRRCGKWLYCPRCAHKQAFKQSRRYLRAFPKTSWRSITISWTGYIPFVPGNLDLLRFYWKAAAHALHRLLEDGYIEGAFWRDECPPVAFGPLRTNPHIHALLDSNADLSALLERVEEYLIEYFKGHGREHYLPPSLKAEAIPTVENMARCIDYLCKHLDLSRNYDLHLNSTGNNNPSVIEATNGELVSFILESENLWEEHHKLKSIGTLSPRRLQQFIGVKGKHLKGERAFVKAVLATIEGNPPAEPQSVYRIGPPECPQSQRAYRPLTAWMGSPGGRSVRQMGGHDERGSS